MFIIEELLIIQLFYYIQRDGYVPLSLLTFELHTHAEALVKSTGWALLPGAGADGTRGASHTHVVLFVLYSPLEETFTGLTREDAIVEA